jgi:ligand-binding sensor domain-containing protein
MLKTKIITILIISFIIFLYISSLSNELWINYTNTSTISCLTLEGNYLWQGSSGGAVRRNLDDPLNDVFYYNRGNGLVSNDVDFIKVDHLGRKWFATFDGITLWDGVTSITYDTSNSGLVSNYVTAVAEDKSGRMWIGTYYGLSVFDGVNWINYDTTIINDGITSLAVDDSGKAWIGTVAHGVMLFDGVNWITYNTSNSDLISNWITNIVIERPYKVWFACAGGGPPKTGGVSVFDGNNWTSYDTSNSGLASFDISSISIDSLGRKWFGGCCGGLSMFDGVNWVIYDTTNSGLPTNKAGSIVVDSSGNLWIATRTIEQYSKFQLSKFDGTNWYENDISENQLASNGVRNIAIDQSDNKWIGTEDKGLCRFDDHNWITYTTKNSGILGDGIGSLAFDTYGNLWILCGGGVSKYDGANWTNYNSYDICGLSDCSIQCMAIDKNNVKWFGTMLYGLLRFDDTISTVYDTSNSPLPRNWVSILAVDSSNNIWLGTMGSYSSSGWLLEFDGINWTVYNPSNSGLPWNAAVWSLAVDALNRIWIGAYGAGLVMFDGSNWNTYNIYNSNIASNYVNGIGFDQSGNTWCATEGEVYYSPGGGGWIEGGGVSKFDGINWVTYNTQNSGLAEVMVRSVAIDYKGNKWFGTYDNGVSFLGTPTEVNEEPIEPLPEKYSLYQNYPNPFNSYTTIPFMVYGSQLIVHRPIRTTLKIYNILGQLVKTLVAEEKFPGNYNIIWDGEDNSGKDVASGIYFYQLKTNDYTDTKKMLLLK